MLESSCQSTSCCIHLSSPHQSILVTIVLTFSIVPTVEYLPIVIVRYLIVVPVVIGLNYDLILSHHYHILIFISPNTVS